MEMSDRCDFPVTNLKTCAKCHSLARGFESSRTNFRFERKMLRSSD